MAGGAAEGDSLCEIITEKVTFEYEIEQVGVLRKTYCPAGSVVPVGYVIAFIGEPDEAVPADIAAKNAQVMEEYRRATELDLAVDVIQFQSTSAPRVRATPPARRLARQQAVDLTKVAEWIGERRAVTEEDIGKYVQEAAEGGDEPD